MRLLSLALLASILMGILTGLAMGVVEGQENPLPPWAIPGVRIWYEGLIGSKRVDLRHEMEEEATGEVKPRAPSVVMTHLISGYAITGFDRDRIVVTSMHATLTEGELRVSQPKRIVVPNPVSQGPIWISPRTLQTLRIGRMVMWRGKSYKVIAKGPAPLKNPEPLIFAYTHDSLPIQAMFCGLSPAELEKLYASTIAKGGDIKELLGRLGKCSRNLVVLEYKKLKPIRPEIKSMLARSGVAMDGLGVVERYVFDVATGLLIGWSSRQLSPGADKMTLDYMESFIVLVEINYDFKSGRGFAERGLDASYALVSFGTGYTDKGVYIVNINVGLASRYGGVYAVLLKGSFTAAQGLLSQMPPPKVFSILFYYVEGSSMLAAIALKSGAPLPLETFGIPTDRLAIVGDRLPFYIPPEKLGSSTIEVLGSTMSRRSEDGYVVYVAENPRPGGFKHLAYDSKTGVLTRFSLYIPMLEEIGLELAIDIAAKHSMQDVMSGKIAVSSPYLAFLEGFPRPRIDNKAGEQYIAKYGSGQQGEVADNTTATQRTTGPASRTTVHRPSTSSAAATTLRTVSSVTSSKTGPRTPAHSLSAAKTTTPQPTSSTPVSPQIRSSSSVTPPTPIPGPLLLTIAISALLFVAGIWIGLRRR